MDTARNKLDPFGDYRQILLLLCSVPEFQERILKLRHKWQIPETGFSSDEAYQAWFRNTIYHLRNSTRNMELSGDIMSLIVEFRLSERWLDTIESYLEFDNAETVRLPQDIKIAYKTNPQTGLSRIVIEIGECTTEKDMHPHWIEIKELQSRLSYKNKSKRQPLHYLGRDLRIVNLSRQGRTGKEIAAETGLGPDEIATILKNYRRRIKDYFGY